jgi:TonB family protein
LHAPWILALLLPASLAAEAPAPPPAQEPEVAPLLREPAVVRFVEAPFPPEARAVGLECTVHLAVEIDETGRVVNVEALQGCGHGFDEAAVEALRQFQFSPAEDASGPLPVIIEFAYGFVLDATSREDAHPQDAESAPSDADAPVNLDGEIREMGTRRPLPGINVLLPDLELAGVTDAEGRFAFRGIVPGAHRLRVVQVGYDPLERTVDVVEGELTTLKLWVRNQSYRDDELVGVYQRNKEEVTRRTLSVETVRRVPGTFGDPVRVIQSLPGSARSPFGTGLLVIRGADPLDSAVYIDGIRVPIIYHLAGYESVINADLVESVDYLPGGYGVEYGRSLGGVVNINSKHSFPETPQLTWGSDLLDSEFLVQGRLGAEKKWGFAAAARRSYIDLFIPYFTKDSGYFVEPRWYDYQLKLDRLDLGKGRFNFFLFGFEDVLGVGTPGDVAQGSDRDAQGDIQSRYSTHRVIVQWARPLGDRLLWSVVPSFGVDVSSFDLGGDIRAEETQYLLELRSELEWSPTDALTLRPGIDAIGGTFAFEVLFPFSPDSMADYDPIGEREPWSFADDGWAFGPDLYLDAEIRPLEDRDRLLLVPGLRLDYTRLEDSGFKGFSFDPRFAARYRPFASNLLKASVGLYRQPPQPFQMYSPMGEVHLDYESAISSTLGFEQKVGDAWDLDAEVFYKRLYDLIDTNDDFSGLEDSPFVNSAIGRVAGLEIMIKRQPVDNLFGWISYTLSKSERNYHPDEGGQWYPYELDQTHILVAVAGYRLPYDFEVSTRLQYTTGNPNTPYQGGVYDVDQDFYYGYRSAAYNSERLPAYFATDLRFEKLFTFKSWQLSTYVDFLNVVRGMNPEFEVYNYDYTESAYVRGLPFIPNPGLEAVFHF